MEAHRQTSTKEKEVMELTDLELKLIEQVRKLDWGKIEVAIKKGKPVMISVKKDIKLDT